MGKAARRNGEFLLPRHGEAMNLLCSKQHKRGDAYTFSITLARVNKKHERESVRFEPHPPYTRPSAIEARHWGATYVLHRVSISPIPISPLTLLMFQFTYSYSAMKCGWIAFCLRVPASIGSN